MPLKVQVVSWLAFIQYPLAAERFVSVFRLALLLSYDNQLFWKENIFEKVTSKVVLEDTVQPLVGVEPHSAAETDREKTTPRTSTTANLLIAIPR